MTHVLLTPRMGEDSAPCTILGAKASGFRDSICCRVFRTVSSYSGLLKQSLHAQDPTQYTPAAKHSQYLSKISYIDTSEPPQISHFCERIAPSESTYTKKYQKTGKSTDDNQIRQVLQYCRSLENKDATNKVNSQFQALGFFAVTAFAAFC